MKVKDAFMFTSTWPIGRAILRCILILLILFSVQPISLYARTNVIPADPALATTGGPAMEGGQQTTLDNNPDVTLPAGVSNDWWTTVQENIRRSEYHITWQDKTYLPGVAAAYQAPNRAHNLRTYFTHAGPVVIPRVWAEEAETPEWCWGLILTGYGYEGAIRPVAPANLSVTDNRIEYRREALTEWYVNDERGLEQGFTIAAPPFGKMKDEGGRMKDKFSPEPSTLILELALTGDLKPVLTDDGETIEFATSAGTHVLRYSELYADDATGRQLPAYFSLSVGNQGKGQTIRIIVDTTAAVYPITIDPLTTVPDWAAESNKAGSEFGYSVSTAGDVNGDGYADVIVGAWYYDNGQVGEGQVFVYHGSATGLSLNANWLAESNQAGAWFGVSVSTAGDVNGDGYADVIAGAELYSNDNPPTTNEGGVFVWHGSANGLNNGLSGNPANAAWQGDGFYSQARFGTAVSTAGDVNGDGYDDIVVGAPYHDEGHTDEGTAYGWFGSVNGLHNGVDGDAATNYGWKREGDSNTAYFGSSVGTAGDVNGDGYADVIIGAPGYSNGQSSEGRVFVYHGDSSGLQYYVNWTAESDQADTWFGNAVSTAGDVNGDGYSDIIVGAYQYDLNPPFSINQGKAFVWHGSANGLNNGVNGTPANANWQVDSGQEGAEFGYSVSTAGDVNGDGYADVIVGAHWFDSGSGDNAGSAFVFYGSGNGLGTNAAWSQNGSNAGAEFGYSVSTAGDVNGDGFADVIIGAPKYESSTSSPDHTNEGWAYVYHGSAGGLSTTDNWQIESNKQFANLGVSVGPAGDVNGDGYADVIVGANGYDNGESGEGRAFVYHGSASGLSSTANWTAESNQENAYFGYSAGTAGDVNGDGFADVIVGSYGYDSGQNNEGIVFLWHGSAGGLGANGTPANADWTAESNQANATFGKSVGTAGDVNGDGYADIIVGADGYSNGQDDEGRAYVYYGSAKGLSSTANWTVESNQADTAFGSSVGTAGDVNGDGYTDVIIGAASYESSTSSPDHTNEGRAYLYHGSATGLSTTANWTAESNQGYAFFGHSVGTAGDVNGDGYADIIVGAYQYTSGAHFRGAAFLWYGASTGLGASGTPANADWSIESDQDYAEFGYSVGTAGDVNGDGYADVIIGAKNYDNPHIQEGRAYVYHGSALGLSSTPNWTAESNRENASFGNSVGTAGDVNGDGYADVIVGAHYYQDVEWAEGAAFLYYGNERDGLHLLPRQMRTDGSAPIPPLCMSDSETSVQLRLMGRMPLGRQKVKLEWQVAPLGASFTDASAIKGTSANWIDTGTAGTTISQNVTGLTKGTPYHWRVRLLYRPGNPLGQHAGRWLTIPWNGWLEQDFRTYAEVGGGIYLPIILKGN